MSSVTVGERRAAVVIEDDLDIRNLVCAILEQGGFQVSGATTGRDGPASPGWSRSRPGLDANGSSFPHEASRSLRLSRFERREALEPWRKRI